MDIAVFRLTQKRLYEGHNTPLGCYTDQGQEGRGQYDGQGEYCSLSINVSEVFLNFTTQFYPCLYILDV